MKELNHDEKVLIYIRKHIIFLFLDILVIFVLFVTPVFGIWFVQYTGIIPSINIFGISLLNLTDILIYVWGIICWLFLAEKFTKYSLNFWILTNKRIVESELTRLFDRRVSTLELPDIEDITVKEEGFSATMVGYGSLEVQTAGAQREFIVENVKNPTKIQVAIFDAKLAIKEDEINIEKIEFEHITKRVLGENLDKREEQVFTIPHDQKFDWAHKKEVDRALEVVDEKYKKDTDKALRLE